MKHISSNMLKVANLLSDLKYHDGESIGKQLQITRTAIWKIIKKIRNYGIKIHAIKGKGYQLDQPLLLIDEQYLKKQLADFNINIKSFEIIDSTNTYLKTQPQDRPTLCIAECQENGRGRFGRKWYSPFGQNLYLSYCHYFTKDPSELAGLSLVVSMAVLKALNELTIPNSLFIKWPNDIVYQNKKLAGILVELIAESNASSNAIIGIGINVNMDSDTTNQINQDWCSLNSILNRYLDRNNLCINIVKYLISYLNKFSLEGLTPFLEEWKKFDTLFNQQITITIANNKIKAIAKGIDKNGKLLAEIDGIVSSYDTGDISLEKLSN